MAQDTYIDEMTIYNPSGKAIYDAPVTTSAIIKYALMGDYYSFDNGGTKAIYRKQRRGKITNAIKFIGIVIAALAGIITIWQFINDVIYSLAHT